MLGERQNPPQFMFDPAAPASVHLAPTLAPHPGLALTLAHECFPTSPRLDLEEVTDPESGEQWLNIRVQAPGSVDEALAAYNRFIERWTEQAPPAAVNQISLTCDLE